MRDLQLYPSARALATVALLVVAACTDSVPPSAPVVPDAERLRGLAVRDAAIRRDDSHFTAQVRISRTVDGAADTDASLRLAGPEAASTLSAPSAETVYVEGGYGAAGEIHFGVYWQTVSAVAGYAGVRAVGDRVELLNAAGAVLSAQTFDAQMAEVGLPGGTLVGAFFPTGEPGLVICPPSDPLCGTGADLRAAGATGAAAVGDTRTVRRVHRGAEMSRRYRRVGEQAWRLEEVRHTDRVTTDQGPRVTLTVMQVTYGAWHRNAARDAARAARPRVVAATVRAPSVSPAASSAVSASAPDPALLEQRCAPPPYNVDIVRNKTAKGLAILYQHGFCADASTFDGMRPRLSAAFTVQRERAFSIATTGRVEAQVDTLIQRVRASGVRQNLVIGHSLGGLLGRRLGQRDSSLVSGVITIGTPHLGALGADVPPEYAADILAGAIGNICVGEWLCGTIAKLLLERNSGRLLHGVPGLFPPVLEDLSTRSQFLQTLNSAHESFPRAGIEVNAGNRWAAFRMIGDARSPRWPVVFGQRPEGHESVKQAEEVYATARFLQFVSMFLRFDVSPYGGGVDCSQSGYAAFWTSCGDTDWENDLDIPTIQEILLYLIYHLSTLVINTMDLIDYTWDWITTRNQDHTDGLIALKSQGYPRSPGTHTPIRLLITPPDADSHAGQTASPRVVDRTIDLVRALGLGVQ